MLHSVQIHKMTTALQSLTGKYRGLQGNPCNEIRDPAMRTGVPCNENMFFLVRIDLQGVPCKPYRVWVCSVFSLKMVLGERRVFILYICSATFSG